MSAFDALDGSPPARTVWFDLLECFAAIHSQAFHTEIEAKGALILSTPTDKDWGMREMAPDRPGRVKSSATTSRGRGGSCGGSVGGGGSD